MSILCLHRERGFGENDRIKHRREGMQMIFTLTYFFVYRAFSIWAKKEEML